MPWIYFRWYEGPAFREIGGYLRRSGLVTQRWDARALAWLTTSGAYLDRVIAQGDPMYERITEGEAAAATADERLVLQRRGSPSG